MQVVHIAVFAGIVEQIAQPHLIIPFITRTIVPIIVPNLLMGSLHLAVDRPSSQVVNLVDNSSDVSSGTACGQQVVVVIKYHPMIESPAIFGIDLMQNVTKYPFDLISEQRLMVVGGSRDEIRRVVQIVVDRNASAAALVFHFLAGACGLMHAYNGISPSGLSDVPIAFGCSPQWFVRGQP